MSVPYQDTAITDYLRRRLSQDDSMSATGRSPSYMAGEGTNKNIRSLWIVYYKGIKYSRSQGPKECFGVEAATNTNTSSHCMLKLSIPRDMSNCECSLSASDIYKYLVKH